MSKILDEIRQAIDRSEHSRYAISKSIGVSQAQLSRLMSGKSGLSINSLERLAEFLNLEIVVRPKRRKRSK